MKINRLIGIITVLQQHKKITAPYLAEKFEVSRRTINRDIEDICRAGVPIVTTQGSDGGISIMDGFQLDTTIFTEDELEAIFIGLKSIDSVSKTSNTNALVRKFGEKVIPFADNMMIDLSSFYKDSLSEKIDLLKKAIIEKQYIQFCYYYDKGEAYKKIEPYLITFKWSDWYVFGYCTERQDFRMYKLRRLWDLEILNDSFIAREIPEEKKQFGKQIANQFSITAIYDESMKYRLVEEYGPESYTVTKDGKLYTKWDFDDLDNAMVWFLSFGDRVEIIDPPEMRLKMKEALHKISQKYE